MKDNSSHAGISITRETLESRRTAFLAMERDGADSRIASEDLLLASRRQFFADNSNCENIWVFGYGSLIYNPIFNYTNCEVAIIYGFHRRFFLWTKIGRGSPDFPGLMLSLDKGGSCKGVAFKLQPKNAIHDLDLLWRREMITLSYRPKFLQLHTRIGVKKGLAFVADPNIEAYAKQMPYNAMVKIIAEASGFNGYCHEYLDCTLQGMKEFGIRDRHLEKLSSAVKRRLASN